MVFAMLGLLLIMIIVSSLLSLLASESDFDTEILNTFILFCLLYNHIVPISLYLAIDFVRICQMIFIHKDEAMFHGKGEDRKGATANNGDSNDEVGQIEYVVAEKTGTITKD
jgi:magnesium-transporting ATPase (P-type)